jgi:hypothetical protein
LRANSFPGLSQCEDVQAEASGLRVLEIFQTWVGKALDSQRGSMVAHHVKGNLAIQMMKLGQQPMTKDLIAQHNLTDDEYKKIVEISECD